MIDQMDQSLVISWIDGYRPPRSPSPPKGARLEGAIAIGEMLRRFPKLRLSEPEPKLTYKGSFALHCSAIVRIGSTLGKIRLEPVLPR